MEKLSLMLCVASQSVYKTYIKLHTKPIIGVFRKRGFWEGGIVRETFIFMKKTSGVCST